MRRESAAFLWDVHAAAARIAGFIQGLDERGYQHDWLRQSAVERQLEIIGEALNNLRKHDPEVAAEIPELHRIIGLRNVLAHGYAAVDNSVVWAAAHDRVPELAVRVLELIEK